MIDKVIFLILLTFVPTLELRWSIPIGVFTGKIETSFFTFEGMGLDPLFVFIVVVIANILLGPIAYYFNEFLVNTLTKISFIEKMYNWFEKKVQKRQDFVDKYGVLAVIFFVGVPLPGSGSWGGAFSAKILNINFKDYFIGNVIGVLIAATIIMALSLGAFSFLGFV